MSKVAAAEPSIHDLLAHRWSPRAFVPEALSPTELDRLLEAARWAPSAANGQPWRFVVMPRDDEPGFAALLDCLVTGNQAWAKNAAALILGVTRVQRPDGKPHRWAWYDLGLAVENLVLQATADGLGAHQMAGFDADRARALYAIPEAFEPVVAIAVGRVAAPDTLDDEQRAREEAPRERKPRGEIIFGGEWR